MYGLSVLPEYISRKQRLYRQDKGSIIDQDPCSTGITDTQETDPERMIGGSSLEERRKKWKEDILDEW